jgi:flagellar motor switch protein FliG
MIKKISATLILDRNIPDSDSRLAKKLASGLLGLPQEREDLVTVEKMDFRKTKPFAVEDLLLPPNLWNLIWTLLAAILGAFTVFSFFKPFAHSTRELVGVLAAKANDSQGLSGPDRLASASAEQALAAAPAADVKDARASDPDRKPPFWFITQESTGNLAFILKTRPVEDITIVLSYAPEAAAAALIEALYPKSIEALANLSKVTLMPEARIKGLEAELFSALDYVVGSEDKTTGIVEQLPDAMQSAALASFSSHNPVFSRKLSAGIVRFSDLRNLEAVHAQMLTRRLPMRNLALALKNSDLAQPFIEKLSGGMQERFRQELDLTRNPAPETQRAERSRVARELKKLIKEGFILPAKAPLPPGAAARPAAPETEAPRAPAAPPPAEKAA